MVKGKRQQVACQQVQAVEAFAKVVHRSSTVSLGVSLELSSARMFRRSTFTISFP